MKRAAREPGSGMVRDEPIGNRVGEDTGDRWEEPPSDDLMAILEQYLHDRELGHPKLPEDVLREHPDWAVELEPYLASIDFLQSAAGCLRGPRDAPPVTPFPDAQRMKLGEYRLVGELGRGGMGVVYEAEQVSLGRRVALKVLPMSAVLDERQLRRFHNEAQAAAALDHPNIVPVYGFGHDDGMHYYAMQLIAGATLAQVVHDRASAAASRPDSGRPSPSNSRSAPRPASSVAGANSRPPKSAPTASAHADDTATVPRVTGSPPLLGEGPEYHTAVAQIMEQVAEALEHAHAEGVLHRDIKPSNLILDSRGKVWVTDFGLARRDTNSSLTASGDLIGTFRYMSPEHFSASPAAIDHRADIYSLGATLYELLTLRAAFPDEERQTLVQRVACDEPPAPRSFDSTIPRDLETIVLKAMAKAPEDRYATAAAMAEDLRRFLDDRPITARRPSLLQRVSRWSRRHRAVVTTATLMTILGLAVSTGVLVYQQRRTSAARWEAEGALILARNATARERYHRWLADHERTRAHDHLTAAFAAVDQMLTEVAESDLADVPRTEKVRRKLLQRATDFYRQFLRAHPNDQTIVRETARAFHRLGNLLTRLGEHREALRSYREAIENFEKLKEHSPEVRHELAKTHSNLALLLRALGRHAEARRALENSLRIQGELIGDQPRTTAFRFTAAGTLVNLANLEMTLGNYDAAERAYRRALAQHERLVSDHPLEMKYSDHLARNCQNLSLLCAEQNRDREAEQLLRRALKVRARLVDRFPDNADLRSGLALSYNALGSLLFGLQRTNEAEQAWVRSAQLREALVGDHPDVPGFRNDLAASYHNLGVLYKGTRQFTKAIESFERAGLVRRPLTRSHPHVAVYQRDLAMGLNSLGNAYLGSGLISKAQAVLAQAMEIQQQLVRRHPAVPRYCADLAGTYLSYGRLAQQSGQYRSALQHYGRAHESATAALTKAPDHIRARQFLRAATISRDQLRAQPVFQSSVNDAT